MRQKPRPAKPAPTTLSPADQARLEDLRAIQRTYRQVGQLRIAIAFVAHLKPRRAVITNMHHDLDFAEMEAELPPHIRPAHDGMVITYDNLG